MTAPGQVARGVAVGGPLALSPLVAGPLGPLGPPFALLVVLPVLALALESFGWSRAAAMGLRRVGGPVWRLVSAYGVWLGTSALLTLDVSAAAGASVGVEVAGRDPRTRQWHLGAALLGSNTGSLLFPFSNLTNLVLVGAAGIGFASFLATAWLPQVGAALAIGAILAVRARRSGELTPPVGVTTAPRAAVSDMDDAEDDRPSLAVGLVALAGAVGSIAFGLGGLDMAIPFALAAALAAAAAVASGRLGGGDLVRPVPFAALALVAVAALLAGPISAVAGLVPHPGDDALGLVLALVAGGLLAMALNNLPAAAFGGAWLVHAAVPVVVAYLIGTNIAALATPHGSAATMLVRAGGASRGADMPAAAHLRGAWRYALAGSVAALVLLVLVAR